MPKLPPARVCLIAEQVRPEPNSKSTILGFYGISPTVTMLVPSFPTQIALALMLLCEVVTRAGDPEIELELLSPSGRVVTPRFKVPLAHPIQIGKQAILVLNFQGLPIQEVGRYTAFFYSMGEVHSTHYFECLTPADQEKRQTEVIQ